jgi:Tfp pilus assembly protein PilZ
MGKRRDPRIVARLEVRIAGIDADGRPLLQAAKTGNISRHGALLEGIQGTFEPGEVISITCKNNKARFRVAWIGVAGTDRAGQIGVEIVDPSKCIWDAATLPASADDKYVTKTKERRQHERVPCGLGAELYMQGATAPVRVLLKDISIGGCFVAMPTLPTESGALKMVVWVDDAKLTFQGVIASRRAGFGISIRFTEMTTEVRERLERYVQPHAVTLRP